MKGIWEYWKKVLRREKKFPWFAVLLVISAVAIARPALQVFNKGIYVVENLPPVVVDIVENRIPDGWELTFEDGRVSSNFAEPVEIVVGMEDLAKIEKVFGASTLNMYDTQKTVKLLVVDTKASAEDYPLYNTWALLTERSLVYKDNDGVRITSLSEGREGKLDKKTVMNYVDYIKGEAAQKWMKKLVYALPWIFWTIAIAVTFSAWSGMAMVVWIVGRVLSVRPGFWRIFMTVAAMGAGPWMVSAGLGLIGGFGIRQAVSILNILIQWGLLSGSYFLFKSYEKPEQPAVV